MNILSPLDKHQTHDDMKERFLYIFLDEGGNFDFSPSGSKYFTITSLTKERPFRAYQDLAELKYNLAEIGICSEYFHASEDQQTVRNVVFQAIQKNLNDCRIDSVIVEKCKTIPALRPVEQFYPKMMGYLVRYILEGRDLTPFKEVLIFTDSIPVKRKKEAIQKAIKAALREMLPQNVRYQIFHHESKSNLDLQIVDYCNWAVYRKHNNGDCRSYSLISKAVKSEFDIFRNGTRRYY